MATKGFDLCFVLCTVIAYCHGATAQSSCTSALISLSPCLNYITGNSSTPSSSCCSQLAAVVQSQPQCLCSVLNGGGASLGINVNQTLALALPGACKVQTPPMSQCNAANGPSTTTPPATAPMSPPADTPDASPRNDPSGNGSKSTEDGNAASRGIMKAPISLGIYIVLMALNFVFRV